MNRISFETMTIMTTTTYDAVNDVNAERKLGNSIVDGNIDVLCPHVNCNGISFFAVPSLVLGRRVSSICLVANAMQLHCIVGCLRICNSNDANEQKNNQ